MGLCGVEPVEPKMLLSQQARMCLGRVDGKWVWAGSWWQRCKKTAVIVSGHINL